MPMKPVFLGFDLSTQQVKVVAVDDCLQVVNEDHVQFDKDLSHYMTTDGVIAGEDGLTYTAPVLMWVEAIDMLLGKMKDAGFKFESIKALSGTAQQHGSVYWKKGAATTLQSLNSQNTLHDQLKDSFTVQQSPVWMDSSTGLQCKHIENSVGGAMELCKITGSPAYERYTGPQIAKIYQSTPEVYNNTERISLVSSFFASLLIGRYAPIDESDGSGMNLLDINTRHWSQQCLDACAPHLAAKLSDPVKSSVVLGNISTYMSDRYGFCADTKVVAFTGDNPATLAGMRLRTGDICISLGTSDTLSLWLTHPTTALEGSVFVNPVDTNAYMGMLCFKNGSLTRERIRDSCSESSWETFAQQLSDSPMGNNGNIGIYFDIQEITPHAVGVHRFNENNQQVESFDKQTEVRALIEGQFMAKRVHAENIGFKIDGECRILATGGASANSAILQVLADVFNTTVYTSDVVNATCLGSAYRAKHGLTGDETTYHSVVSHLPAMTAAVQPTPGCQQVYDGLCTRYRQLEQSIHTEK